MTQRSDPTAKDTAAPAAQTDAERLRHELGVHQVELELQNEQLRQTQIALEASRDRYVDLYEQAPIGYVTLALNGAVVEANRLALVLLEQNRAQLAGRLLAEYVVHEDRARLQQHLRRLLRGTGPEQCEVRLRRAHDAACWVALQMAVVHDDTSGTPQCRVAIVDISERMRMQEGVARLAAIVSSSGDAIIGRDLAGRVSTWNDGAARLFGVPAGDVLGATMDAFVPEELRDEEKQLLLRLRRGEKIAHVETERLARGGVRIPLSMSLSPVLDEHGAIAGSALIARDISERRRAEAVMRERLRQLDVIAQGGQALIMNEHDPAKMRHELSERVRVASQGDICLEYDIGGAPSMLVLRSAHGITPEQAAGLAELPVDDSLCGLALQRLAPLVIDELQACELPQARRLKAIGARCFAGLPLVAHGRAYGVVAFVSTSQPRFRDGDVLVMRTLCDQTSAMLERSRLMEELHVSEQTLKRADRTKDDFIATLAHELRNPLAPIRNAIGILRRDPAANGPQIAWCRDIIDRQVVLMTRLLEDLLDVSRLTRNRIELRRERFELAHAIEQAIETTQPLMELQRHRLSVELPAEPIVLYGDPARLTQVFANLLNNAAKYSDRGGEIVLAASREGEEAVVSVRDSGIGIDAQHLPKVFDMFAQLAPALERSAGGLGIGLALARGLVELHGGSMAARSAGSGLGSEFVVRLPIAGPPRAEGVEPRRDDTAEAPDPSPRRLLVVDDNVDAAQTLAAVLELHGQEVRVAYGGAEALRIAAEWRPDAAVLDIGMPGINGYELCAQLRAMFEGGAQPLLIACTGWGQDADRERARAAGFDHHVVKPIEPAAMLALLAAAPTAR